MEQNKRKGLYSNILAPKWFGFFSEDIALGKLETVRGAVGIGWYGDMLGCPTMPTPYIHDSRILRAWNIHETLVVSPKNNLGEL